MLNSKTLKKLFIITTICVVPILLIAIKPLRSSIQNKGELLLPQLLKNPEHIARVIIQDAQGTLTFEHKHNAWKILEKNNFPVLHDKVEELLFSLSDLRVVEPKTTNSQLYAGLGVNDIAPNNAESLMVTVQDNQNHDRVKLIIGRREGLKIGEDYVEQIFVRSAGDSQTWLVQGTLPISSDFKDWVEQPLLGLIDSDQLKLVQITNLNGEKVLIQKTYPEQEDFVLANSKAGATRNVDLVNTVPFEVAELEFEDVVFAADQNIDWSESVKAEIETFSGLKIALNMVRKDGVVYSKVLAKALDDSNEDAKQIAAAYNDSKQQWYYKLSQQAYDEITISNAELLN